jgi:hypothetical protein
MVVSAEPNGRARMSQVTGKEKRNRSTMGASQAKGRCQNRRGIVDSDEASTTTLGRLSQRPEFGNNRLHRNIVKGDSDGNSR